MFYRNFEPLGLAQGLPPYAEEQRRAWIDGLLAKGRNLGAFAHHRLVGHITLLPARRGQGEVAYFVDRKARRRGIGGLLLRAALAEAKQLGYRKLWASVMAGNVPSIRMLRRCGFRPIRRSFPEFEMLLELTRETS